MNKTFSKLFLTNLGIVLIGFLVLGIRLRILQADYGVFVILAIVMALGLTLIVSKLFLKPIQHMEQVAQKIVQGDFKSRLSTLRQDEFGDLAAHLNQMSADLQKKVAEIMRDKNELQAILSSMVEGVVVISQDERIVILSAPVYEMLEFRSREVIGKPYWEVIRHEEINSLLKEAMVHRRSIQKEITIISPQERHFSVQVSAVLLNSDRLSGVVAVFHDITNLKRLDRVRAEFVANVSHEFKTPLTTIKGFVETLQDGAVLDKEKAKRFLDIIHKHTERLEYLVNDLLDLASLESPEAPTNLELQDIGPLIDSAVNLFKKQIEDKSLKLEVAIAKDLPKIPLAQHKIEQVFSNLIDNAIKFTPEGAAVMIQAHHDNGGVRIDFIDTGIGIDAEHLPRIFERFYRVDKGRSRDMGGTGLGLAIVKHIIQNHQGKISVESQPGIGTTFSVFLPMDPAESSTTES